MRRFEVPTTFQLSNTFYENLDEIYALRPLLLEEGIMPNDGVEVLVLDGSNNTATFSGQVTIPATPVASTDAASKSYVDAQVSATDSLQEVTTVGNTTTNSIMIGSSSSPSYPLHVTGNIKTTDKLLVEDSSNSRLELASSISNQARISAHKTNLNQTLPLLIQAEGIKFGTVGGGEKMRLTSAGELCVGYTTNQGLTAKLLVNGNAYFSGNIYPNQGVLLEDGSSSAPSLKFNNDTDTGLYRAAADTVGIAGALSGTTATFSTAVNTTSSFNFTGNNAYIKVGSTWNTGVLNFLNGPTTYLIFDIPNGRIQNNLGKYLTKSSGVAQFGSFDNYNVAFVANNLEKMRLSTSGNLLIGTTTDDGSSKLQVNGGALFTGSLTFNQSSAAFINHNINSQSVKFRLSNSSALDVIPFEITPTYMASTVDMYFGDSDKLKFGAGNDLEIFSDGNDGFINNETNHFYITNNANNCDLALRSDDGLGGVTDYIRLDGSQETVNVYKTLLIGTTTNTGAYKIDVAGKQRVQDTLELDDVLMLNAISTPSDPAAGKSVIYMDSSDGGIKCKINVGGTVVTRTIASFE